MVNFNGTVVDSSLLTRNRAFLFGDGVFETVRILNGRVLFIEDHYFRLMSSMRIMRMEIPMNFTMEFIESQILEIAAAQNHTASARARMTVYRNDGGFYLPTNNNISYLITSEALPDLTYIANPVPYEVDLFKDFYITRQLLSTIKTTNRALNITGSIYANENGLQNCLLLNEAKNVVEALNGNLFMLTGNKLVTPPISEGCLNGVMRRQILTLAQKSTELVVEEEVISPFELQKADELFITNVVLGIQPITRYRKKQYRTDFGLAMITQLNVREGLV